MKVSRIYIPANKPEDWRKLLAKPRTQWRTGYSAKALACCWQEANDFPESVRNVFKSSSIELFQNVELLLAFPEYKVPLPGGARPSQNDIFILARGSDQLIAITVEGKASESFGETVVEWKLNDSEGKQKRLHFLCEELQLQEEQIDHIRYQLLHRTASAIIEAHKCKAENALMLVHSFSKSDEWIEGFKDYQNFLALYGLRGIEPNSIVYARNIDGINLYFGWVSGEKKYLEI